MNKILKRSEEVNKFATLNIPISMLNEAGISSGDSIKIVTEKGKITIYKESIFDYIPDELMEIYKEMGYTEEVLEAVLLSDFTLEEIKELLNNRN